ncbi:MAG: single-stranded-DNA-specific exonuclease RecJ [bacterium]
MQIREIQNYYDLSKPIAEVLKTRGYDNKFEIDMLLSDDLEDLQSPLDIPNIVKVKDRVEQAINDNEFICIFHDYDVDGITSATVLYNALKEKGGMIYPLVSTRERDGYSLSLDAVDIMINNGVQLLITVDCGITSHREIEYAEENGIDVIVIDHHNAVSPPVELYLDLKVSSGDYMFTELSACGIVWKFTQVLLNDYNYKVLDLVALSTVADLVPLVNENRIIVKNGIKKMEETDNLGLQSLLDRANLEEITSGGIGYKIAPMINAMGRLSKNKKSFDLLTATDKKTSEKLAGDLFAKNQLRKQMQKDILKEVEEKVDTSQNIILYKGEIPKGLTGLVAGDLLQKYNKPAIVINEHTGKGSGRSLSPLNLQEYLQNHLDIIDYASGHSKAFGIGLPMRNFERFKKRLYSELSDIEYQYVDYDIDLNLSVVNKNLIKQIDRFQPFGIGFPSFKFKDIVNKATDVRLIGANNNHLKFKVDGVDCIAFSMSEKLDIVNSGNFEIIYSPDINKFRGKENIQAKIRSIKERW